jgi:hypothetical protein
MTQGFPFVAVLVVEAEVACVRTDVGVNESRTTAAVAKIANELTKRSLIEVTSAPAMAPLRRYLLG